MRLYLEGKSLKEIGYTPDWINADFVSEKGVNMTICFDVRGEIGYKPQHKMYLNCNVKGDLTPWTLINNETGEESTFEEFTEEELDKLFPQERIFDILKNSREIIIGIYPADYDEDVIYDERDLSDTEGRLSMSINGELKEFDFAFIPELNL